MPIAIAPTVSAPRTTRSSSPAARLQPRQPQPLKVVALGDSLVYGFGDVSGGGWVERLRRQWMHPASSGHVLYNLGVRGDKVAQVAARLEIEFRHRGELRNQVPDCIILSVGTNDTPRLGRPDGRPMTPLADFMDDLDRLLDRASQLCPVLFVGMLPVNPERMPFLDCLYYNLEDQYAYKEATRLACQEHHIPYLDCFDLWRSRGTQWVGDRLSEDGLHPNELGYSALLEDVLHWQPLADLDRWSHRSAS